MRYAAVIALVLLTLGIASAYQRDTAGQRSTPRDELTATGTVDMAGGRGRVQPTGSGPHRHPNLASAQRLVRQAWNKILEAQKANEWDMGGHAQKAKELLDQVSHELRFAADEANENLH